MLELIKTYHQKSAIFLRKTENGFSLASFVLFDQFNNARLLGQKTLNPEELQSIIAQKETLESQNIFIIEEPADNSTLLIESGFISKRYGEVEDFVPSLYFSNLFRQAEFFSTQKTRGPNR